MLETLNLDVAEGEFIVLLGPSGCGKSTLLNCIAGLLDVSDGQIFIKGKNVTWEEPKDRGIGMVFQSYALYPQMTVEGNLSFGLTRRRHAQGRDRQARRARRRDPADRAAAASASRRRFRAASASASRSAGRWCATSTSSCSTSRSPTSTPSCARNCASRSSGCTSKLHNTMIYVTHDQIEAMTLADRIAVMKGGVIQQLDTPQTIYNRPVNRFVAGFIGSPAMNFLDGRLEKDDGNWHFVADGCADPARPLRFRKGAACRERRCSASGPSMSPLRQRRRMAVHSHGDVEVVEPMGSDTLVWRSSANRISPSGSTSEAHAEQRRHACSIGFDPMRASLFDAATGNRL